MADEVKQPGHIGRVLPLNPSRGSGERKRPRRPPQGPASEKPGQRPDDDPPHRVDEYV